MRRESYLSPPPQAEVYKVDTGMDMILRRNISEVEKETMQDGQSEESGTEPKTYTCYECEEVQYRYKGTVTKEEVEARFDYWWDIADGLSEIEAADKESETLGDPTMTERIEALEGALAELAEVMING